MGGLHWKPSSHASLGLAGGVLALPSAPGHASRLVSCVQNLAWLGFHMSYPPDWRLATSKAFEAAHHAWHANRKVLYSRKLSHRCRLLVFAQTVTSILLSRLVLLPILVTVIHRV